MALDWRLETGGWSLVGNVIPQAQAKEMLSRLNARQSQGMGPVAFGSGTGQTVSADRWVSLGLGVIMVCRRSPALSLVSALALVLELRVVISEINLHCTNFLNQRIFVFFLSFYISFNYAK